MPLTPSGTRIKAKMAESYGSEKGERIFYATMTKKPTETRKWHRDRHRGLRGGKR